MAYSLTSITRLIPYRVKTMILVTFLLTIWINGLHNQISIPYETLEDCQKNRAIYLKKTISLNTSAVCIRYTHK